MFKLHRKNLQAYAGALPIPEDAETPPKPGSSAIAKIKLPESASVLGVIFEYLYPARYYPYLENMKFEDLMAIADAVEKYQVFSAIGLCVMRIQ